MSRDIVIHCDACTDGQTAGKPTRPMTLGGYGPGTLDLCEMHEKELIQPLADLLASNGLDPDGHALRQHNGSTGSKRQRAMPAPEGGFICVFCDDSFKFYSGYQNHFPTRHGLRMGEAYGSVCPLDGVDIGHPSMKKLHIEAHGSTYMGGLFVLAQKADDPEGVVTKQIAAVAKAEKKTAKS